MSSPENPFDPAQNPDVEYIPYDEDPAVLHAADAEVESRGGRELRFRLTTWKMARGIAQSHPEDNQAQSLAEIAEQAVGEHLKQWGISRSVRPKTQPEED